MKDFTFVKHFRGGVWGWPTFFAALPGVQLLTGEQTAPSWASGPPLSTLGESPGFSVHGVGEGKSVLDAPDVVDAHEVRVRNARAAGASLSGWLFLSCGVVRSLASHGGGPEGGWGRKGRFFSSGLDLQRPGSQARACVLLDSRFFH